MKFLPSTKSMWNLKTNVKYPATAVISLVSVCIIVMGHCQGVISHPDIDIFSRTASTTVTPFLHPSVVVHLCSAPGLNTPVIQNDKYIWSNTNLCIAVYSSAAEDCYITVYKGKHAGLIDIVLIIVIFIIIFSRIVRYTRIWINNVTSLNMKGNTQGLLGSSPL